MLNGPTHIPSANIKSAVVFLHGYGSNGDDLMGLVPSFRESLPETAFFAPHAPQKTAIGVGRQWFSDAEGTFRDKPGLDLAAKELEAYLEETIYRPYGLKPKDVVLVGFSMGTMTALHTAPRLPGGCAGVVGFSGALMFAETLPKALKDIPQGTKMPILLIHGLEDDVVPFHATELAAKALEKEGFDVQMQLLDDLGHGIDSRAVRQCLAFLERNLQKQT